MGEAEEERFPDAVLADAVFRQWRPWKLLRAGSGRKNADGLVSDGSWRFGQNERLW